jgi:hypothetical protein
VTTVECEETTARVDADGLQRVGTAHASHDRRHVVDELGPCFEPHG